MSITITIEKNISYCKNNDLIEYETYDCLCYQNGGCIDCKGTSIIKFEIYPFEMNLANGNFHTFFNSLGISSQHWNSDPRLIREAIENTRTQFGTSLIERSEQTGTGENGCSWVDCGIGQEQAESYLVDLEAICVEAEKRKERICWG